MTDGLTEITVNVYPEIYGVPSADPSSLVILGYLKICEIPSTVKLTVKPLNNLILNDKASVRLYYNDYSELIEEVKRGDVINRLEAKGISPNLSKFSPKQEARAFAVRSRIVNNLLPFFNYLWWEKEDTHFRIARKYYADNFNVLVCLTWPWLRRKREIHSLRTNFGNSSCEANERECVKKLGDVLDDLVAILDNNEYLFGNEPSVTDVEAFAHLSLLFNIPWRINTLRHELYSTKYESFQKLLSFVRRFQSKYFPQLKLYMDEAQTCNEHTINQTLTNSERYAMSRRQRSAAFLATFFAINGFLAWKGGNLSRFFEKFTRLRLPEPSSGRQMKKEVELYEQHAI